MKRISIFFMTIVLISCSVPKRMVLTESQLRELHMKYERKHYFDLRDALRQYDGLSSIVLSYYRGVRDNKFNRLESSIKHLRTFIRYADAQTDGDKLIDCWEILGDDYTKAFRYEEAAGIYRTILDRFGDRLDAERKADMENYVRIFSALKKVPVQTAEIKQKTVIQFVEGGYIPMRLNTIDLQLGLDTGANYSFIMRSLAQKTRMKIIDADINIDNVAGQVLIADLGVASKMEIGHAELENVVFLVFEDRDLFFERAKFQIKGCIGFPVVASLGEVVFHKMSSLTIPATPSSTRLQNLCLDELTPIVAGYYRGQRFAFCLDTGAGKSVLYPPFFKTFKQELKKHYPLQSEKVQGLGGFREIPAYVIKEAAISFGNKRAIFRNLPVLTDFTLDVSHFFFGNIGRDLLNQFNTMTLNFKSMFVKFE